MAREAARRMTRTLPWSWYVEPEQLARERDRIFAHAWQYVGHAGEAAEPGTYFTSRAGHVPVIVTRGRDRELRGFVNVCRHRGHPVATGSGRRETLQCPYHAWTYGLDGSLRSAPRSDREADFATGEVSLRSVRLDTWGPFVFANADLDAPPLADALGRIPALVAELLDVKALDFRLRDHSEIAANWKVVCENYLECYHCPVAHPGFSGLVDVSPDAYRLEPDGLASHQFATVRPNGRGYDAGGEIERGQFHFLWPNLMINIFPGRPNVSLGPVLPTSAERSERLLDYFFAPDVDAAWIDELLAFDAQVGREDRALVEGVQRGVSSGLIDSGWLLPESERLIVHFQQLTARALDGTQ
jgi:phenylpropionate dioxygenase-like ring-hydroxylating dioxygenase large terminal subunit